jgi:hypothetical protein
MPLIRIDLEESVAPDVREGISKGLHRAMVDAMEEVPEEDNFQVMTVHGPGELAYHASYAGPGPDVEREGIVYVQMLIDGPHDTSVKRALYDNIARELQAVGVKRDDIFVALTTNGPDDWWAGSSAEEV